MDRNYQFIKNENKGVIPLTKQEYEYIDQNSRNYSMYVTITEVNILQLCIKSGLTNANFETENSEIANLIESISKCSFESLSKNELVYKRLEEKITEISVEDWNILKEELTIFPEKFEKLVKRFNVQLHSKTNDFDDEIEQIIENLQRIGELAKDIYSLLYMKEILLRNSK